MATQSSFPGGSDGKKSACNDVNTILFLEVHTSSIISVKLLFSSQNTSFDCRHYIYILSMKKGEIAKSKIHLACVYQESETVLSSVQSLSHV